MLATTCTLVVLALSEAAAPDWKVKKLQFSAVSIGVAMKNHTTGWSSFTNGASGIQITKTVDGGATWNPVKNDSSKVPPLMIMGVGAATAPLDVATTGMMSTKYSTDGDLFKGSAFGPFVSQSIRTYNDSRVILATDDGVCVSKTGGKLYGCTKATPVLTTSGRYAAWPSEDVIYLTAGEWPSAQQPTATTVELTSQLRLTNRTLGGAGAAAGAARVAVEYGRALEEMADEATTRRPADTYTAQIVKSTDGGKTWTSVFNDTGSFYFNEIDCIDETRTPATARVRDDRAKKASRALCLRCVRADWAPAVCGGADCVAVGEGFSKDGSASPGARVYVTTDGQTFKLAHQETTDGSSLMAAKMLSAKEHVAGGRLDGGVALHSTDGGATYVKQGSKIKGQMITALSFITPSHGFATAVNALQICSLLEFGSPPA